MHWISRRGVHIEGQWRIHRSLLVSISPNSSLLPPLRKVAAEVADAEEWTEKAVEGLLARTYPAGLSCL